MKFYIRYYGSACAFISNVVIYFDTQINAKEKIKGKNI